MAARKKIVVEGIPFDPTGPTAVALDRLQAWVVWQFPRLRAGGHSGAVHPSEEGHGWYPAVINPADAQVIVYAHLNERFPSPEAAAKHLDQLPG